MAVAWNDDPPGSETRIAANIRAVGAQIYSDASHRRPPSLTIAQAWHRAVYAGVQLPVPYYAGEVRDSDRRFPELIDYEVQIGRLRGVPAAQVPAELELLQTRARNAVAGPDGAIPVGNPPATPVELRSVLLLQPTCTASGCASTHSPTGTGASRGCGSSGWPRVTACRPSSVSSHDPRDSHTQPRRWHRCPDSTPQWQRSWVRCSATISRIPRGRGHTTRHHLSRRERHKGRAASRLSFADGRRCKESRAHREPFAGFRQAPGHDPGSSVQRGGAAQGRCRADQGSGSRTCPDYTCGRSPRGVCRLSENGWRARPSRAPTAPRVGLIG